MDYLFPLRYCNFQNAHKFNLNYLFQRLFILLTSCLKMFEKQNSIRFVFIGTILKIYVCRMLIVFFEANGFHLSFYFVYF